MKVRGFEYLGRKQSLFFCPKFPLSFFNQEGSMENFFSTSEKQSSAALTTDFLFQKLAAPAGIKRWPERIVAEWRRFSCGLWRIAEGDISAAYCADTFPRLKTFSEEGHLFTTCGCFGRSLRMQADCYPLLPFDGSPLPKEQPFTYEGRIGACGGMKVVLGPKVVFASTEPTVEEWRDISRAQYADGGWFASQATYGDFLSSLPPAQSENERIAVEREMNSSRSCHSKIEMRNSMEKPEAQSSPGASSQMTFF